MELVELPDPEPGDGEVVVDVARAGINFADTHATRNDYLAEQTLPLIPGGEIAGRTADGRRVAAILAAAATPRRSPSPRRWLVPVPDEVSDDQAAGLLLQGLTAHALRPPLRTLQPGETVVVQAAGGGTGTLAVQLAKRAGARVIALASSEEKRELAAAPRRRRRPSTPRAEDLRDAILEANGGRPGRRRARDDRRRGFEACLRTLAPFGRMVALRNRLARAERGHYRPPAANSRAVIGFWLVHLIRTATRSRR